MACQLGLDNNSSLTRRKAPTMLAKLLHQDRHATTPVRPAEDLEEASLFCLPANTAAQLVRMCNSTPEPTGAATRRHGTPTTATAAPTAATAASGAANGTVTPAPAGGSSTAVPTAGAAANPTAAVASPAVASAPRTRASSASVSPASHHVVSPVSQLRHTCMHAWMHSSTIHEYWWCIALHDQQQQQHLHAAWAPVQYTTQHTMT